jgi:hypothetical protein
MLRMVSYPHRPLSGHIMCYLNRTYHVLPTRERPRVDSASMLSADFPRLDATVERDSAVHEFSFLSKPIRPFAECP